MPTSAPPPPLTYLDHAATTPMVPEVRAALLEWSSHTGNASSSHSAGRSARAAVEDARDRVAAALGRDPLEIVFTAGGTEADNTAVKGLAWASDGRHVVTSSIEHPAVLDTCRWLATAHGYALTVVPPQPDGVVDPGRLLAAVRPDTAVVSLMTANNELGTVQPVEAVAAALAERGICFHTDAVQAFGRVDLPRHGVTALSLSSHKHGGPQGVGVLVLERTRACVPLLHGGGQERELRSGTFNTAGIVAAGVAAELAAQRAKAEGERLAKLRDRLQADLLAVPGVTLNGEGAERLPSHLHVAITGCAGDALAFALDQHGVAVSTGSACASGAARVSHVLAAIGADPRAAQLRFSLGHSTTAADVGLAATAVRRAVADLRAAGGGYV